MTVSPDRQEKLRTRCTHCGAAFAVAAAHVGKRARCAECHQPFVVSPDEPVEPAVPGHPAPAPQPAAPRPAAVPPPLPPRRPAPAGMPTLFPSVPPTPAAPPTVIQPTAPARTRAPKADDEPMPQPAAAPAGAGAEGPMCPLCQSPIGAEDASAACPACQTVYHKDCWDYNDGGCAMYGCEKTPEIEMLGSLEIPPAHWGSEDKACPQCGAVILAAAVRCRSCGTTFESAAPQEQHDFNRQRQRDAELPGLRTRAVWLLVCGMLSCTAPLAAIIGGVWVSRNRKRIAALPGLYRALAGIGLVVAVVQTVLIVIVALSYAIGRS